MKDLDQHKYTDHKAYNTNILHTVIPETISGVTKAGLLLHAAKNLYFRYMLIRSSKIHQILGAHCCKLMDLFVIP